MTISEVTREKMRQAALHRSPEAEARRIAAVRSPESRAKISAAGLGRAPGPNFGKTQRAAWRANRKVVLTYAGIHAWVRRRWGKADRCELCGKQGLSGRKAHWMNKNHRYTRRRRDWLMACRPCHAAFDQAHNGVSFVKLSARA